MNQRDAAFVRTNDMACEPFGGVRISTVELAAGFTAHRKNR